MCICSQLRLAEGKTGPEWPALEWLVQKDRGWNGWSLFHRASHFPAGQPGLIRMVASQGSGRGQQCARLTYASTRFVCHILSLKISRCSAPIQGAGKQILPLDRRVRKGTWEENRKLMAIFANKLPKVQYYFAIQLQMSTVLFLLMVFL